MKIIKYFLKAFVFIAGFLAAVWFFMPWKQVGEYALLVAAGRMKAPAALSYSSVKNVSGGFMVEDLNARGLMGIVGVSCKTLTVVPDILASLLNLAPTCRFAFTGNALSEIPVTPFKKISGIYIGDGRVDISVGRQAVLLDGLRSNGDLSLNGAMALTPAAAQIIGWADVLMGVKSEAFEKELPILQQALGMPLQQEGPGRWALRRARPGAQKEARPVQ